MGYRGTIEIWENGAAPKDEESPVVLYTHWGAGEMLSDLKEVLSRKKRWSDPAYLSRMIFSKMIKDDINGETGYGIMTNNVNDAEEEIVVDCDRQEVIVKGRDNNKSYTFSELAEQYFEVNPPMTKL
jgi:hypothetical protein